MTQMTRSERRWGWCFFAFQMLLLPSLINYVALCIPRPYSSAEVNFCYHLISFLAVSLIFRRFFSKNLRLSAAHPVKLLLTVALCLGAYYAAQEGMTALIYWLDPGFFNVNDNSIIAMRRGNLVLTALATVLLAPVTEESLYRGLLFGSARRHGNGFAYLLSAAVFASVHVVGYLGQYSAARLGLCFLQYLPAGLILAAGFHFSGTLTAPILTHMIINAISMVNIL